MENLTQATLDATDSKAVLGKEIGNQANVIGVTIGTFPDLDVLLFSFEMSFKKQFVSRVVDRTLPFY